MSYIYWFALYNLTSPSVRYRGFYLLEALKQDHGVDFAIVYPGYSITTVRNFLKTYISALLFRKPNSLIVIQRVYTNRLYATALKLLVLIHKKNTLYDIDDAEYVEHSPATINFFMKHCSSCSTGSKALLSYVKRFNFNAVLLTSPVTKHHHRKQKTNSVFTIGWIGCYWGAHKENLFRLFFPGIREVNFPLKLIILGARYGEHTEELKRYFSGNQNIILDIPGNIDWFNESAIYERIKEFDVGISPLLDTEINRCKSAYKLKQYCSCGVPVLGSEIGENAFFLKHGFNGFFCNTPEDYLQMILKIKAMSPEEYSVLCTNAFASCSNFDLNHVCKLFLKVFPTLS